MVTTHFSAGRLCLSLWLAGLTVLSAGCGGSPYDLAKVRGSVTVNGQPLTQAKVMFSPIARSGSIEAGKAAFGVLQPDGSYVLGTYGTDDGAVVGEHRITLTRWADSSIEAAPIPPGMPKFRKILVPGKFEVVAGEENEINVRMTIDEVRKYASQ